MVTELAVRSFSKNDHDWIDISIDSPYFVAGDRVSGEILVQFCNETDNSSLNFKSSGVELIKVTDINGKIKEQSNNIYTLSSLIAEKLDTQARQVIFPFTFKLPLYSPASFHFLDTDTKGNQVLVSIEYEIEATITTKSLEILKTRKILTILSKNTRKLLAGLSEDINLSFYGCCYRRSTSISIQHMDQDQCKCGSMKKYKVNIRSDINQRLISLSGQVLFEIAVQFPDGKSFYISKSTLKTMLSLDYMLNQTSDPNNLELDFEVDLMHIDHGSNPCSNYSSSFTAEYKLQLSANYKIGCSSAMAFSEMVLHVDPYESAKEPSKPLDKWEPKEYLISNLTLDLIHQMP
jgi:hypothetical protein